MTKMKHFRSRGAATLLLMFTIGKSRSSQLTQHIIDAVAAGDDPLAVVVVVVLVVAINSIGPNEFFALFADKVLNVLVFAQPRP
jgi:hypothetical protein